MNGQLDAKNWGEALSDLADGRADARDAQALCAAWAREPGLRRDWHALHLIGDTLRSTDLAQQAQRSGALLDALRVQLAHEPVPLRPRRAVQWMAPLAVAASFVAMALMLPVLGGMVEPAAVQQAQATQPLVPQAGLTLVGNGPSFVQTALAPGGVLPQAPALIESGFDDLRLPEAAAVTSGSGRR